MTRSHRGMCVCVGVCVYVCVYMYVCAGSRDCEKSKKSKHHCNVLHMTQSHRDMCVCVCVCVYVCVCTGASSSDCVKKQDKTMAMQSVCIYTKRHVCIAYIYIYYICTHTQKCMCVYIYIYKERCVYA